MNSSNTKGILNNLQSPSFPSIGKGLSGTWNRFVQVLGKRDASSIPLKPQYGPSVQLTTWTRCATLKRANFLHGPSSLDDLLNPENTREDQSHSSRHPTQLSDSQGYVDIPPSSLDIADRALLLSFADRHQTTR